MEQLWQVRKKAMKRYKKLWKAIKRFWKVIKSYKQLWQVTKHYEKLRDNHDSDRQYKAAPITKCSAICRVTPWFSLVLLEFSMGCRRIFQDSRSACKDFPGFWIQSLRALRQAWPRAVGNGQLAMGNTKRRKIRKIQESENRNCIVNRRSTILNRNSSGNRKSKFEAKAKPKECQTSMDDRKSKLERLRYGWGTGPDVRLRYGWGTAEVRSGGGRRAAEVRLK